MNDQSKMEIKIFGGTNTIAPVATTIVQNFYGDQFAESALHLEDSEDIESLNNDECHLFTYVPDVKKVHEYVKLISECTTAHELAGVVSVMLDEPHIKKDTVVKAAFIEVLLPFATHVSAGRTIDNVRQQINNMLAARRKGMKKE